MALSKKVDPAVSDLLTRAARTGLSDQDVHARASLPNGWLSQARAGRYGPGADSVRKLRRWLERFEAGSTDKTPTTATVLASAVPSSASPAPAAGLLDAIRAAKTYESLGGLIEQIMLGAADGSIEKGTASVLVEAAREGRQLVKGAEHEKAMQALTSKARLLSAQEAQWITDMRAAKTPAPLTPDQAAPPPPSVTL